MFPKIQTMAELISLKEAGKLKGAFELSNELYHAGPGVSKSQLDDLARSPMRMKYFGDKPKHQTEAMLMGSATEEYLVNKESFSERYAIFDVPGPRNKNPVKQQWDAFKLEHKDKTLLSYDDGNTIKGIRDAIKSHPIASKLTAGVSQLSFYWTDPLYGVLCKCRPDFILDSGICVDLKVTDNASYYAFRSKVMSLRYHVQEAFYMHGIKCAVKEAELDFKVPDSFAFVVVERDAPIDIACYELDEQSKALGFATFNDDLATYKQCVETDTWPGYKPEIKVMSLPPWAFSTGGTDE